MPWNIQPQSVASSQTCELTLQYAANNAILGVVAIKADIKLSAIYVANNVIIVQREGPLPINPHICPK